MALELLSWRCVPPSNKTRAGRLRVARPTGALWLASPWAEQAAVVGQRPGLANWAGSGSEEGFGFLLPFTSLSSRGTVTRGCGRSGGAGPPRAPGIAGRRLGGNGHPRSQGQGCFPQSFDSFLANQKPVPEPRGLLATPGMQAARAGRPESPRLVPTCPHPAPPRLVFGSLDGLRRKCQRSCAIGEMDDYFEG